MSYEHGVTMTNVCFIKICTKHSINTLLSLVQIFMKQKLLFINYLVNHQSGLPRNSFSKYTYMYFNAS